MIITIKGVRSKTQKKMLMKAVTFFAEHLIPKRTRDKICLTVYILNDLDSEADGFTELINYDSYDIDFVVEVLRDIDEEEILKTLAHEMVHVKQYALQELVESKRGVMKFRGEKYEGDDINAPWEIEAYEREKQLLELYYGAQKDIQINIT